MVRFEGINDRTAAEGLVHQELLVAADDLPELEEGEFHLLDLQGLNVYLENAGPEPIRHGGDGSASRHGGLMTCLRLSNIIKEDGIRRCLVPFVEAIVPHWWTWSKPIKIKA